MWKTIRKPWAFLRKDFISAASYRMALAIDPWHVETHLNLGMDAISDRDWGRARLEYEILRRVSPEQAAHLLIFIEAARRAR